jgi:hypothetical protein
VIIYFGNATNMILLIKDVYTTDLSSGASGSTNNISIGYNTAGTTQVASVTINGVINFLLAQEGANRTLKYLKDGVLRNFGNVSENTLVTLMSGFGLKENATDPAFLDRILSVNYELGSSTLYQKLPTGEENVFAAGSTTVDIETLGNSAAIAALPKAISAINQYLADPIAGRRFELNVSPTGAVTINIYYTTAAGMPILDSTGQQARASLVVTALETPEPSSIYPDATYTFEVTAPLPTYDVDGFVVSGGVTTTTTFKLSNFAFTVSGILSMCLYASDGGEITVNGNPIEQSKYFILASYLEPTPLPLG